MTSTIYIDKRSLLLLFFLKYNKAFILALLIFLFAYFFLFQTPISIKPEAWKAIGVFFLCISLWVSNVIPKGITGILAIALIPALGILPKEVAYSLFGNQAVFFILGAFLIASAYSNSGLSRRMAIFLLRKIATSPKRLLLIILFLSAFLSLWMPEHAIAAILFPLVMELINNINSPNKDHFSKGLLFALIWGCSLGGVGTFLGGARNILAVGLLNDFNGSTISFSEWIIAVLPFVIVSVIFAAFYITHLFKLDFDISTIREKLLEQRIWIGKTTTREYLVGIVILLTILSWVFLGESFGITNIALISAVLLFVLNLITWNEANSTIQWDILLMYGGAISLGSALYKSGAIASLVEKYLSNYTFAPIVLIIIFALLAMILTEAMSNSAVVILLLPIGLNLCQLYHIDTKIITLCVAVPSGLAFMLPIASPPNAICFASGLYSVKDSIKYGILFCIGVLIIFFLTVIFYWPLIGLKL